MNKIFLAFSFFALLLLAGCLHNKNIPVNENLNNNINQPASDVKQELEDALIRFPDENAMAVIKTNLGEIKVKFYSLDAPNTVNNFIKLSNDGFYNGTKFHRVIKDFMIQGGDPNSKDDDWSDDGFGGPGYKFPDEINDNKLVSGVLAMANSGPNTNGSQFFIVTKESTPWLDGLHTAFGEVIEGLEVVDKIEAVETNARDHPITDVIVQEIVIINQ
ncbi:MAG TPA: peptidylprolyl isomerase [Patescibacteria group bacterium]